MRLLRTGLNFLKLHTVISVTVSIDSNGKLVPMVQEERIPESVHHQIHQLKECGLPSHKPISLVLSNLVPVGRCPMPFQANVPETEITTMRSMVATLYFRHDVATWKRKGVDFSLYMYILEVNPTTGKVHHEREDHCHIFKRIAKHTKEGACMKLKLDAFDEATRDLKTGLTHTALVAREINLSPMQKSCCPTMFPISLKKKDTWPKQNIWRMLPNDMRHQMGGG